MSVLIEQRLKRINMIIVVVVLANMIIAGVLYVRLGVPLGWMRVSLSDQALIGVDESLSILQFPLGALLADLLFRRSILKFNLRYRTVRIPNTVTQVVSIVVYGFTGLTGYILLFEHSVSTILAASGAIGLGLSYALKDWIAGVQAGVQIQFDRIFGIGDWIQIRGKGTDKDQDQEVYEVMQVDRRMVTLRNHELQTFQIPCVEFVNGNVVNFTRQRIGQRRVVEIQIDAKYEAQRILTILDMAIEYLIRKGTDLHEFHYSKICGMAPGHITYLIKYEVAPKISRSVSNGLVLRTVLRFLSAASINLESSIHVDRAVDPYDNNTRRLLEIREQGILRALRFGEIVRLASKVRRWEFRKDERLIEMNAPGDSMYFLSEGSLTVHVPSSDGETITLADLWPGDCFGEMSLLTGEPRSADITAMTDGVVLEISKLDLAPLLEENPNLARALADVLEARIQENANRKNGLKRLGQDDQPKGNIFHKIMSHFGLSV